MLFSEVYKLMVNKVTFGGFREGDHPPPGSATEWDVLRQCQVFFEVGSVLVNLIWAKKLRSRCGSYF